MSASNPAAPDPTHIGKFQIVQKLGAGAFGTVYKAQDPELGRFVAIKTIRLEGLAASQASLDDLLARFKREARVAAALKHPNIVTIHDIGALPGNSFLVMEFVDGVGLDRVIAKSGKMSTERAASIGAQVASALAFAHKHNVVHRDIKPANVMIEPGDHVKVTDFGIAKVTDSVDHLTATGSLLGTPSYMSPEQARGGAVDGRSDLFSVGCVLYEMVAGQKAFRGDSITALLFKILTEEPPPLRELDPTVPDEMIRVIGRALAKSPETRYQDGQELANDLLALTRPGFVPTLRGRDVPTLPPDAAPADVPTLASPPTHRPEATISSAETRAQAAAPGPGTPPPLPPTVVTRSTVRTDSAPAAPPRAAPARGVVARPPARPGMGPGLVVALGIVGVLALVAAGAGGWYLLGRRAPEPAPSPTVAAATAPAGETPAEAVPTAPPAPSTAAEATPRPVPSPAPATVSVSPSRTPDPGGPRRPAPPGPPPPAATAPAAAPDYAHLDELPPDTPDGRAAGDALAQKYRGGGASGYSTMRFRQRARVPPGVTLPERPAVATLLYLYQAEEAFHRRNGRYGHLQELADAHLLALDVPFRPEGFRRARYGFRLIVESDGFRVDAVPQGGAGRAFLVDDAGFVRLPDDE